MGDGCGDGVGVSKRIVKPKKMAKTIMMVILYLSRMALRFFIVEEFRTQFHQRHCL